MPTTRADRREQVFSAAVECFSRYGYRRTSMDDIARAAGMSRPAIYQHVGNKDAVFADAVRWALDRQCARVETAVRGTGDVESRVGAALAAVLAMYTATEVVAGEVRRELVEEIRDLAPQAWAEYNDRAVAALSGAIAELTGDRSAGGMDHEAVAAVLLYGAKGIALETPAATRAAHVDQLVTLTLAGLRVRE